jgi:hypothetical protein
MPATVNDAPAPAPTKQQQNQAVHRRNNRIFANAILWHFCTTADRQGYTLKGRSASYDLALWVHSVIKRGAHLDGSWKGVRHG